LPRREVRSFIDAAKDGLPERLQWVNVTSALTGEYVGLEPIDDGLWDVYFGVKKIGRLHERHMRIEDHLSRLRRHP
jgi:putative transposase